jgi:hypothetical protein
VGVVEDHADHVLHSAKTLIVNVEVWDFDKPVPRQYFGAPGGATVVPDVPNWSWHESSDYRAARNARLDGMQLERGSKQLQLSVGSPPFGGEVPENSFNASASRTFLAQWRRLGRHIE